MTSIFKRLRRAAEKRVAVEETCCKEGAIAAKTQEWMEEMKEVRVNSEKLKVIISDMETRLHVLEQRAGYREEKVSEMGDI